MFHTQVDLADVLEARGQWEEAAELVERLLASARASAAPADKRAIAFHRAAGLFASHGDAERAAALLEEAQRVSGP